MEAVRSDDGSVTLRMTEEEAVILHVKIADSEFASDLEEIELRVPVEQKVFSDVQQALAPLIPGLGTDRYQHFVAGAYAATDPGPF
jgi:hypothetical protein